MGFAAVESARKHLDALVSDGKLIKLPGVARGYRLAEQRHTEAADVPVVGAIPAGNLEEAIELPEGYLVVESRFDVDELFALRVRGESMRDVGILDGDIVIVRQQPTARSGDIVCALVGDEATVKTLRIRRGQHVLEPANPAFEPIAPDELQILGKVVEVRRQVG